MALFDRFSLVGGKHLGMEVKKGEVFSVTVKDESDPSIIPITRSFIKKKVGEILCEGDLRDAILNARTLGMAYQEKNFRIGIRKFRFTGLKKE